MNSATYWKTIIVGITTVIGVAYAGEQFEISRYTIDSGGQMRCTGGDFELSGTIGQPDAGVMAGTGAGADFELTGGFWFALASGDCNEDGGVDLFDVDAFRGCLSGPTDPTPGGSCRCFDVDRSNTVDVADFAAIQGTFTGS